MTETIAFWFGILIATAIYVVSIVFLVNTVDRFQLDIEYNDRVFRLGCFLPIFLTLCYTGFLIVWNIVN